VTWTTSKYKIKLPWYDISSLESLIIPPPPQYLTGSLYSQADTLREKDTEKAKFDNEKKKLDEELARIREQLKKALSEGALTETKQKELAKLAADRDRVTKELLDCRNDLEAARKAAKTKEEDVRRKEADLQQNREGMKLVLVERDDIKKERDELETKVLFNFVFLTGCLL
jgi:soluble cytochrome b562